MRVWIAVGALVCVPVCVAAQSAIKPCEDLKVEIAKKLDAKGVTGYTLTIVEKGKQADGKVVGSCDAGTKAIVYEKAKPASEAKPAQQKKK